MTWYHLWLSYRQSRGFSLSSAKSVWTISLYQLISFLRPERVVSADALKDQMEVDKQQAIRIFTYTDRKVDRNCLASVYNRGAL